MKRIISFLIFFNYLFVFSQGEIQPEIGFSGNGAAFGFYNTNKVHDWSVQEIHSNPYNSGNGYVGFISKIGSRFIFGNKSFLVSLQYQWFKTGGESQDQTKLTSNLLGLGTEIRFFEKNKVKLLLNVQLMSEVSSGYRNNYLRKQNYRPIKHYHVLPISNYSGEKVETNIYKGTPFIGNFLIGCNVKIVNELSFNFSVGYGLRVLRSQLANLTYIYAVSLTEPTKEENIDKPYLVPFHMLDFQAGLSYTFSMKKKSKTEEL